MEKEELLKRAQEDNRDGDEREKLIMDKINRIAAQSAAAIVLVMSLLTYLGVADGEIAVGGHLISLSDALILPLSLYMLLYHGPQAVLFHRKLSLCLALLYGIALIIWIVRLCTGIM